MEELLDLLEEEAFDGVVDALLNLLLLQMAPTITHREIINAIHEQETQPFASLEHRQGAKERKQGPKPRPGHTILVIMNLLRNLTIFTDNTPFHGDTREVFDLFLRVSSVVWSDDGHYPRPASLALSLSDVVIARRDTLHVILNLAHMIHLSPTPNLEIQFTDGKSHIRTGRILSGRSNRCRITGRLCETSGLTT
jgi:SWI/SNF chromatin-remodeling complex subunit SWI1